MAKLLLVGISLICLACGSGARTATPSTLTVTRSVASQMPAVYPYCDDSTLAQPCPCEDGYTCVRTDDREWCLPVWEADCRPRCIPASHPWIVCQGNAEVHGIAEGEPVDWMAVQARAASGCTLGNGWTWRVWGVKVDDRPRIGGYLDGQVISSWRSPDTNCPSSAPNAADNLPHFYERNPGLPAYLLMPPGYGGAVGEIAPTE